MMTHRSRTRGRSAGDGGTHWISYSDMMASLLLIFILAVVLSIYNYYQLLEIKTKELGEQQAQLDAVRTDRVRLLKGIDTLEDLGVLFPLAQNNTGHTREYAQHNDGYQFLAFHDDKITE